jgi:hypothetical protein
MVALPTSLNFDLIENYTAKLQSKIGSMNGVSNPESSPRAQI